MEHTITSTTVAKGYGQTRKTRKSAQREVDAWTNGERYLYNDPEGRFHNPAKPVYFETIATEVEVVEGGFACCYVTTREYVKAGL